MNQFNSVELRKPQKSTFDLTHDKRISTRMGRLTPILVQECVPSDYFEGDTDMLVRLAPLLAPIYDQVQVYVHYFFVSNRLLWLEWEKFITGGQFGPNTDILGEAPPVVPQFNINDVMLFDDTYFDKSRLSDYLGVPLLKDLPNAPDPDAWDEAYLDCLPYVAYQKIWFDYYRDRNFVNDDVFSVYTMPIASGEIDSGNIGAWTVDYMSLRFRHYKADYFMTTLPWAQRGAEVMIPSAINYLDVSRLRKEDGSLYGNGEHLLNLTAGGGVLGGSVSSPGQGRVENIESVGPLVNDWRTAYALQVWLERNAVGGSRYNESIQAHFGVRPQDARLQRAEYIGGGLLPIRIQEVVATAWSVNDADASVPQGNMAGHGVGYGATRGFKWFCPEHGFIMGILSIINPPSYHQGLPRMFRRRSFLDYPFPSFAKLGEQEVFSWEVYAAAVNLTPESGVSGDVSTDWPVWGYQSRYADWKTGRNTSHGDFHDSLLFWTLTLDFGITPTLDEQFVQFRALIENRIFAVPGDPVPGLDHFWIYLHNRVRVKRPLPYFGTPNTLGFQ